MKGSYHYAQTAGLNPNVVNFCRYLNATRDLRQGSEIYKKLGYVFLERWFRKCDSLTPFGNELYPGDCREIIAEELIVTVDLSFNDRVVLCWSKEQYSFSKYGWKIKHRISVVSSLFELNFGVFFL